MWILEVHNGLQIIRGCPFRECIILMVPSNLISPTKRLNITQAWTSDWKSLTASSEGLAERYQSVISSFRGTDRGLRDVMGLWVSQMDQDPLSSRRYLMVSASWHNLTMSQVLEMLGNLRGISNSPCQNIKIRLSCRRAWRDLGRRAARIPSALCPAVLFGQRFSEPVIFFLTLFVRRYISVCHGLREKTKFVNWPKKLVVAQL